MPTPGPWFLSEEPDGSFELRIDSARGAWLLRLTSAASPTPSERAEDVANARRIVQCVNNFDSLAGVVGKLVAAHASGADCVAFSEACDEFIEEARAALAKSGISQQ